MSILAVICYPLVWLMPFAFVGCLISGFRKAVHDEKAGAEIFFGGLSLFIMLAPLWVRAYM